MVEHLLPCFGAKESLPPEVPLSPAKAADIWRASLGPPMPYDEVLKCHFWFQTGIDCFLHLGLSLSLTKATDICLQTLLSLENS